MVCWQNANTQVPECDRVHNGDSTSPPILDTHNDKRIHKQPIASFFCPSRQFYLFLGALISPIAMLSNCTGWQHGLGLPPKSCGDLCVNLKPLQRRLATLTMAVPQARFVPRPSTTASLAQSPFGLNLSYELGNAGTHINVALAARLSQHLQLSVMLCWQACCCCLMPHLPLLQLLP